MLTPAEIQDLRGKVEKASRQQASEPLALARCADGPLKAIFDPPIHDVEAGHEAAEPKITIAVPSDVVIDAPNVVEQDRA